MACGTGKTFTSLKIAETIAGQGKRVLFLVPSLALISQTIREWTEDTEVPLRSFAVCSDTQVGKRRKNKNDALEFDSSDLALPATTDAKELASKAGKVSHDLMTVVFSTYHSIQVISDAQKKYDLPEFDLIICDEAHRTTGAVLGTDKRESEFIKVHDNSIIRGKKRLYMTATPKIFTDKLKKKADASDAVLASMDDETLYGKQLHHYTFAEAVDNELLTPYKIVVLGIDETYITPAIQEIIANENREIDLDDAAKIIGCYRALTKIDKQLLLIKKLPVPKGQNCHDPPEYIAAPNKAAPCDMGLPCLPNAPRLLSLFVLTLALISLGHAAFRVQQARILQTASQRIVPC